MRLMSNTPANERNTLAGFTHENGFRVFSFQHVGDDRAQSRCTVRADLALIRAFGIPIQDLPLLCRGLLDRCEEGGEIQSLTFTEADMRGCATERAALREGVARKRKTFRRPAVESVKVLPGGPEPASDGTVPIALVPRSWPSNHTF
jgi:hypothetical protein